MTATIALPVLAGGYSTINESIRIGENNAAGDVESVNGSIRIGSDSVVRSVNSVNGSINVGKNVTIERGVESVNGAISLDSGSQVGDDVETVNGGIDLQGTHVAGDIDTVNGSIALLDGTVVTGHIKVHKPDGWGWNNRRNKPVKVEIGENVEVLGDLIFEHEVELRVHPSATYGEIIGDEVTVINL